MRGVYRTPGSRLTWSHVVSYQILPYLYSTTSHNVPTYMIGLLDYIIEVLMSVKYCAHVQVSHHGW
jgi:hypothetical protein